MPPGQLLPTATATATAAPTLSTLSKKLRDMVSRGLFDDTLRFYKDLHASGIHANGSLLPSLLKASSSPASLHFGLQLHSFTIKTAYMAEPVTANALISMYAKCSLTESARLLFDTMPLRDAITWNSMIMCYVQNGYFSKSIELFKEMHYSGFEAKSELIASVVSLCGRAGNLRLGREIHGYVICGRKSEICVFLSTAFVDMYSRCHDLHMASRVFERMLERNEVSWTAMIKGCVMNGNYYFSLEFFRAMQVEGIKPNRVTIVSVLPSCAELGALRHGKEIHGYVLRHDFVSESHLDGALIDMYCKCEGATRFASLVFERAKRRDVVMWSSMIGSYSRHGDTVKALNLFHQMQMEGISPNSVTLLAIVAACISLSSANYSHAIHGYIVKSGLNTEVFIGNSLIHMYSKCGCLEASHRVFEEMPLKDPVSWSALISGYGLHGYGTDALRIFHEMLEIGIEPDQITFLSVLSACNHTGLINEGQHLFNHIIHYHGISPNVEHYACFIDLLGRAGRLEDAYNVVNHMPMKPSMRIWSSLVSACRVHGRFELAETLAHQLINLEPDNAANYTLLSTIYAETSNWDGMEKVRKIMRERGLKKRLGYSQIEIENGFGSYPNALLPNSPNVCFEQRMMIH